MQRNSIPTPLSAPFPYYGGKSRWSGEIWARFGRADVYAEPFAGSLAVLLANPSPAPREVVCDKDGLICNFWRSLKADPEATAHWADYPTIHQDLTARHKWLRRWGREHASQLVEDAEYFDAKAAGWWVWGISLWIGGGWCSEQKADWTQIPKNSDSSGGGRGVSAQRATIPDKRPIVKGGGGAHGVSAQRLNTGQIPAVCGTGRTRRAVLRNSEGIPHTLAVSPIGSPPSRIASNALSCSIATGHRRSLPRSSPTHRAGRASASTAASCSTRRTAPTGARRTCTEATRTGHPTTWPWRPTNGPSSTATGTESRTARTKTTSRCRSGGSRLRAGSLAIGQGTPARPISSCSPRRAPCHSRTFSHDRRAFVRRGRRGMIDTSACGEPGGESGSSRPRRLFSPQDAFTTTGGRHGQ